MPYLRRKRSTRPAVSISFCLPVKNGWQEEQISTLICGFVDRVSKVLPHAHVTTARALADEAKDEIVTAAIGVFREKGYGKSTIADIVHAAQRQPPLRFQEHPAFAGLPQPPLEGRPVPDLLGVDDIADDRHIGSPGA